jgi:FkbM family methyltransferase
MLGNFMEEWAKIEAEYRSNPVDKLIEICSKPGTRLVIFGAGACGTMLAENLLPKINELAAFCDNNKSGSKLSFSIISPTQLRDEYYDAYIVVAVSELYNAEIYEQVLALGFTPDKIFRRCSICELYDIDALKEHLDGYKWAYDFFTDEKSKRIVLNRMRQYLFFTEVEHEPLKDQYFDSSIHFSENEVFVDGGCYIGDTSLVFIDRVSGQFGAIIGFEPDISNYESAKKNLAIYPQVQIVNQGLYHINTELSFDSNATPSSKIMPGGGSLVSCTSLDNYLSVYAPGLAPTFIKLDIEGSEQAALRGMQQTIEKYHPKLAICVYHKPDDIYAIPQYIASLGEYKLFLRHYTPNQSETVLYAL